MLLLLLAPPTFEPSRRHLTLVRGLERAVDGALDPAARAGDRQGHVLHLALAGTATIEAILKRFSDQTANAAADADADRNGTPPPLRAAPPPPSASITERRASATAAAVTSAVSASMGHATHQARARGGARICRDRGDGPRAAPRASLRVEPCASGAPSRFF